MMPPNTMSVAKISRDTGVSDVTLYNWRNQFRHKRKSVPADPSNPENWSGKNKLSVAIETAALNEQELTEHCRQKGLYAEQIFRWREAAAAGARYSKACAVLEVNVRILQRWKKALADQRNLEGRRKAAAAERTPANKLSDEEREAILAVCIQQKYQSLPPTQIVPRLADNGEYIASESSYYRVLREADQVHRDQAPDNTDLVLLLADHTLIQNIPLDYELNTKKLIRTHGPSE